MTSRQTIPFFLFLATLMAAVVLPCGAQRRLTIVLEDSTVVRAVLPEGRQVKLPLRVVNEATGKKDCFKKKEVFSVELAPGEPAIDGIRYWQTVEVSSPSVFLGRKHVQRLLLGRDAEAPNGDASVFRWDSKVRQSGKTVFTRSYALQLKDVAAAYPFIQDDRVWLRDVGITFGKSRPDVVNALRDYYIRCGATEAHKRQEQLRVRPASILQHLPSR